MSLLVRRLLSLPLFLAALCGAIRPASAQKPIPQADRIAAHPDLRATTRLPGHVPARASTSAATDAGPVSPDTVLRLTFVLSRSAERQAAFTQLLADQQNPSSTSFHRWLTPQQIGLLYGPTQHDLDTLTTWLTSQGLAVTEVAPSRTFVTTEAPVSAVANALSISFRYFNLNEPAGQAHPRLAVTSEPAIPTALAAIISSISGLADVPIYPMVHSERAPLLEPLPLGTSTSSGKHYIAPNDFAVLYNLSPVYQSGINGANQKIAIIGRSRVLDTDISLFEKASNLPTKQPNVIIPPAGVDPGTSNTPDQDEATLDVDRVLGTAPGVQADLVVANATSGGIQTAAQYEVQTLLDPVMNISFGTCETSAGPSGVTFWDTVFSQAAAEGISVFISSGDAGAAACQTGGKPPSGVQARSINVLCASTYATCVGGTEFADFANPAQYWGPTNGTGLLTALSYIPEGAWNEPGQTNATTGVTTYVTSATGGGVSAIVPKPTWQTGPGVPADGFRDVPDISFSASNHNGYFGCLNYAGADCITFITFFSGTSASAPSMAAIAALLNQKTGTAQGNLNPLLYRLAASSTTPFHDATPSTSGVACDLNTPSMCNNSTPSATGLGGGLAGFALTPGYDQATGLGSIDVSALLSAVSSAASISLSPASPSLTFHAGATTGNTDLIAVNSSVFAGSVALGCTVSFDGPGTASSVPICSLTPSSLTLAAGGSATSTLAFTTTLPHAIHGTVASAVHPAATPSSVQARNRKVVATIGRFALCSILLLAFLPSRRSRASLGSWKALPTVLLLLVGLAGLGSLSACSGSSTPASPNPLLVSPTNTTLAVSAPSIFAGGTETFSATVVNSGFNTAVAPAGTVQFFQGGATAPLASATLSGGTATAAAVPFATSGGYTIFASYGGDNNFSASSSAGTAITVMPAGTTTGSYTVTINATAAGGLTASTAVALTVQ